MVLERGEGANLWDTEGKQYLDFAAGIAVNSLGAAKYSQCQQNSSAKLWLASLQIATDACKAYTHSILEGSRVVCLTLYHVNCDHHYRMLGQPLTNALPQGMAGCSGGSGLAIENSIRMNEQHDPSCKHDLFATISSSVLKYCYKPTS